LKNKLAPIIKLCTTDWTNEQELLLALRTQDETEFMSRVDNINDIIERAQGAIERSDEIQALLLVHSSRKVLPQPLMDLSSRYLTFRRGDIAKLADMMTRTCANIAAVLELVDGDDKNKDKNVIGLITDKPPKGRVHKDARQFHLKYPKVDRFELMFGGDKEGLLPAFLMGKYFMPFFHDVLSDEKIMAWARAKRAVGLPKRYKKLFKDFNYHPDIVLQFLDHGEPLIIAFPIFQWRERSTIDYSSPPTVADVRAMVVINTELSTMMLIMRDSDNKPKVVTEQITLKPDVIQNVALWFKIPDMVFEAL
jgi:hypothetical protein